MPVARIPLAGSFNERGLNGQTALAANQDQRFLNCMFSVVTNAITGKSSLYVEKRYGWGQDSLVAAGSPSTGLIRPQSFNAPISAFGGTDSTLYFGTTSIGTITGRAMHFTETLISGVAHICLRSSDGTGWYYVAGAKDQLTYTGDTHTNLLIDNIATTAGMYIGQKISGTNIVAGTRIAAVSANAITVDTATTGTTAGITITKEPIAKIVDTDFITTGSDISAFVPMGGYLFYATADGNIRNSDLNSVTAYTSTSFLAVQQSPDANVVIARQGQLILVFGTASKEGFQNAGISPGSPLATVPSVNEHIGAVDQRSMAEINDDLYFVATPHEGESEVRRLRGAKSEVISTPTVNKIIGTASSPSGTVYASAFALGGYKHVAFVVTSSVDGAASNILLESGDAILLESGGTDNLLLEVTVAQDSSYVRTLVYNVELNLWSEWDAPVMTFVDGIGTGSTNQILATSRISTSGKIYRIDPVADGQLYRDDGDTITMEIRTSKVNHDTDNIKTDHFYTLVADQQSSGTVTLETSDDDYATWVSRGSFDLSQKRPRIFRGGAYKGERAYRLRHSDNAACRLQTLVINYSVGTI